MSKSEVNRRAVLPVSIQNRTIADVRVGIIQLINRNLLNLYVYVYSVIGDILEAECGHIG